MKTSRIILGLLFVIVGLIFIATDNDLVHDVPVATDHYLKSDSLEADKHIMWNTVMIEEGKPEVSPVSAINASRRVIETVKEKLIGQDHAGVEKILNYRPREAYAYHAPFFPSDQPNFSYRFDTGAFGWQYTFLLDDQNKVTKIDIQWIH